MSRLKQAFDFMKENHGEQERKTGGYYYKHPQRVSAYVMFYKESEDIEDLMIAGLLHDTVEDTDVTIAEVRERFGDMVANITEELTSIKSAVKTQGKTEYLIEKMVAMTTYGLVVKLCDRLDNVSDLDKMHFKFQARYTRETFDIIEALETRRGLTETHKHIIKAIRKTLHSK